MRVNMNGFRANMADEFNKLSKQIEELHCQITPSVPASTHFPVAL